MPTPLYDVLKEYASSSPGRWHMPGHKGNCLTAPELMGVAPLDVTELPSTGNLYTAGPPLRRLSGCGRRSSALNTASSSPGAPPWGFIPV